MVTKPLGTKRRILIDLRLNYLQQKIIRQQLDVMNVPGTEQNEYILTYYLRRVLFTDQ